METWKEIKDYPCYMVSSEGRVKSLKFNRERILSPAPDTRGYLAVPIRNHNGRKNMVIHRLVANAFIDKLDGKECVNHINGIKTDNNIENLEWCTQKENVIHSYSTNLAKGKIGTVNGRAMLNESQVLEIRSKSDKVCNLAREYGVTWSCVKRILLRQTWTHI